MTALVDDLPRWPRWVEVVAMAAQQTLPGGKLLPRDRVMLQFDPATRSWRAPLAALTCIKERPG